MDFYDVLATVMQLLQREGRASYRALKRQFNLDDAYIEDLKEELLFSHPVVDEDGRGLVWTGATEATPVTTSQLNQPEPPPVVEQAQPVQATSSPVAPHTPEAERRQLTVMFCDLVGSTSLSGELDPEDLREVIRAYQATCTEVVHRYDGYVAQLLGDGLLVYFGYPQAHEDDAQRAVRAGLGIVEAIGTLNTHLEQDQGVTLALRLGIHTGLVVVGEMGGSGRQEQLALGEAPNVAARIQGIAQSDTLVISADTYRLIQGYFDCDSLGEHDLRGVSQAIVVYRVVQEIGAQSRLDIASARGLTPLVGREQEVGLLLERWARAQDGQGQVVLLSGEAGIGKSRLIQVLKDHVADTPHTRLECRSSPYFTNSALYPIIDMVQRVLRFQTADTAEQKLAKLEAHLSQYHLPLEEMVPLFGALLSVPIPEDCYAALNLTPQRQRQKTLEAIVAIILELSERQPVLFILEDLHWTDPTTLEFIELLMDQTPTAAINVLLTCRPEFQPSWRHRSYLSKMSVNRLSREQIERMAEQVVGDRQLPDEIAQQLVDKTDGVPLYVEEMTKAVLESGVLKETNGHYELAGSFALLSIPDTLQDSLMARLDRLVSAKAVAQSAAVLGRQFTYELLSAVSPLDEATLQQELARLVEAEMVYQRGMPPQATYAFKHALIQDAAYQSLLRSTRQQYHQHIAQTLVVQFPDMAETQPELLAHHYTEAGLLARAIPYWQRAGQRAIERSAHLEAISHLQKGLALLKAMPDTPEGAQQELLLLTTLGPALMATQGYAAPEVEGVYARARELCQQAGETPQLFWVLMGLWGFYNVRAKLRTSRELGELLLHLAVGARDPVLLVEAYYALGDSLLCLGELISAREHFAQGIARYDPQRHHAQGFLAYVDDPGVFCLVLGALTLWILGYPDQALQRSREALAVTQGSSHLFGRATALTFAAVTHQHRQEIQAAQQWAEEVLTLSNEQGFPFWAGWGAVLRCWARAAQGDPSERPGREELEQARQGLTTLQAAGAELVQPYLLGTLAEAYGKVGQADEGLTVLTEALFLVDKNEERWWEAEIHRLRGVLLLRQPGTLQAETEAYFQRALDVARLQEAKSFELRAAMSLARLWQSHGKRSEAYELLAPIYNWFTEGFDTADLQEAKALLDELGDMQKRPISKIVD